MNLGGYSSNSGGHFLGFLLLICYVIGPYILLWLEIRAFIRSEAQSGLVLFTLVLFGAPLWYYGSIVMTPFSGAGLFAFHLLIFRIATFACPVTLAWEAYKRGWFSKLLATKKKKRRRVD